ncbi:MAG: methylated-DNA--[protein]-cysteine S-methyltransferase, partial [Planctomycetota bacterium]|nr:methylated-DNA--[protein]-cysteine S-methyltransferase [Planctomycetota bacterium]
HDIRECDVDPQRLRDWFLNNQGITFGTFLRARRLGNALSRISRGHDLGQIAKDAGYASINQFHAAFQKWYGCNVGSSNPAEAILVNRLLTPLGHMIIACDEKKLVLLEFADHRNMENQFGRLSAILKTEFLPGENNLMNKVQVQLDDYFTGSLCNFSIPLLIKGTSFQESTWKQVLTINYGKTAAYQEIGRKMGKPNAQRAVGRASGDNRIVILIPCHRVIRQTRDLSGYSGGIRRKEWMLKHEQAVSHC